jgi:two-component system, OmpR family, sensor kinase
MAITAKGGFDLPMSGHSLGRSSQISWGGLRALPLRALKEAPADDLSPIAMPMPVLATFAQVVMFRFLNMAEDGQSNSAYHRPKAAPKRLVPETRRLTSRWRWPLTARVPIVSGTLILLVAIALSRVMMDSVAREQELGVRQIAAVYLDGIATTVYPHVFARNLANTTEALRRTMWFHQGMREQRAIVKLPDGTVFADVAGPNSDAGTVDPLHDRDLNQQLKREGGFVFDAHTGTGWLSRDIVRDGNHVADLYVAVELKELLAERQALRRKLFLATILAGLGAAAFGSLIVRRMVSPVRLLTEQLRRAQTGKLERVSSSVLPPASTEYGRLLRGYNDLVDAIDEREALAVQLTQRERESVLGRLAATIAHEVRNPLGGMSMALNTVRKFGDDLAIRAKSLDLIERGLWSIGNVVNSVLAFHRMPSDWRRLAAADLDDLRVLIAPELMRRHLELNWDCDVQGDVDVAATETRQIALNLLLNACEASPTGSYVGFRASLVDDDNAGTEQRLVLQVTDEGQGLPVAVSAALTEGRFDPKESPQGLGIRVIRELVQGLGGAIVATHASKSDHGSCIVVTLPVGRRDAREIVV